MFKNRWLRKDCYFEKVILIIDKKKAHIIPIAFITIAIKKVRTLQIILKVDLVIYISHHIKMNALTKVKK